MSCFKMLISLLTSLSLIKSTLHPFLSIIIKASTHIIENDYIIYQTLKHLIKWVVVYSSYNLSLFFMTKQAKNHNA